MKVTVNGERAKGFGDKNTIDRLNRTPSAVLLLSCQFDRGVF